MQAAFGISAQTWNNSEVASSGVHPGENPVSALRRVDQVRPGVDEKHTSTNIEQGTDHVREGR